MKSKSYVSVYLMLFKGEQLLLSLRKNTGYEDDKWSLVAGHVECGESALTAMVREAKEEISIDIEIKDLDVVHIMHRKSDRENIDIFIKCSKWQNEIINNEPHKCGGLEFVNIENLPFGTIDYIQQVVNMASTNICFSEYGW